jgi:hypothetical protein
MSYINFNSSDFYSRTGGTWRSGAAPDTSFQLSQIVSLQAIITDLVAGLAKLTVAVDADVYKTFTVTLDSDGARAIQSSALFIYAAAGSTYGLNGVKWSNANSVDFWLNREYVISTQPVERTSQDNTQVYRITYGSGNQEFEAYASIAVVTDTTNQDVVVESQPATEFFYVNPLSLCWDITVVNHATGATNTIHTPLLGSEYNWADRRDVVPFGGFMLVFEKNDNSRTFIYFIDNDGNLVDQIDGGGPGYEWNNIDYRVVWAADNDSDGSVVKIFDGKNVRTYEFPYLAYFNFEMWDEGDASKNLYVPFVVDNYDAEESYLYISTPGGDLIDLDGDSWYNNERWTTIHPTSDKIFRATDDGDGLYVSLDVYTEYGTKVNSFNLTSYNVNTNEDKNYYGTNGDFYALFYNDNDSDVPYLFVVYKVATNTFVTFTSTTAVDGYNTYYQDHEVYENNIAASNTISVIIGEDTGIGTIIGMNTYNNGGTIYWVPANGTSWLSYEINDGDSFEISTDDGVYGTNPLFIVTSDTINANLNSLLLLETGTEIADTGIPTVDAFSVNTSCLHDYTYARISVTDAPNPNIVNWKIYGDEFETTFITGPNTFSNQEGGTIVVLDTDTSANNWSWTTADGSVIVPAATDSFEIVDNMFGGYWNPWGYSTNGHQVLIDKDGSDQVVGLYFLSENSTEWTYMPNSWDSGLARQFKKGLNNFGYITYTGDPVDGNYVYMNYDIANGALISAGTTTTPSGGNYTLEAVGDRMSAQIQLPSLDREFNCFTGAGIVKVITPSSYNLAFNDADWSWDD